MKSNEIKENKEELNNHNENDYEYLNLDDISFDDDSDEENNIKEKINSLEIEINVTKRNKYQRNKMLDEADILFGNYSDDEDIINNSNNPNKNRILNNKGTTSNLEYILNQRNHKNEYKIRIKISKLIPIK
jgi:hypothetical protein